MIEHLSELEAVAIFHKFKNALKPNGRIFLTTPARAAKPILEFMAFFGRLDKASLAEHKHYWNKKEIFVLAEKTGLAIKKYKKFQLGFNQLVVFEPRG